VSLQSCTLHMASGLMKLTTFDVNYKVRSIVFAASWFAAHPPENLFIGSSVGRVIS
jgi:hypothetical protein